MADIKSKAERSANMSMIKGTNTGPELAVRKYLTDFGVRYRCNVASLPGKPDIAIKKYNLIIKVNGCFWHAHENCKDFKFPKSNEEFWKNKLTRNRKRDFETERELNALGYTVFIIWECQIKCGDFSEIDNAVLFIKTQISNL